MSDVPSSPILKPPTRRLSDGGWRPEAWQGKARLTTYLHPSLHLKLQALRAHFGKSLVVMTEEALLAYAVSATKALTTSEQDAARFAAAQEDNLAAFYGDPAQLFGRQK